MTAKKLAACRGKASLRWLLCAEGETTNKHMFEKSTHKPRHQPRAIRLRSTCTAEWRSKRFIAHRTGMRQPDNRSPLRQSVNKPRVPAPCSPCSVNREIQSGACVRHELSLFLLSQTTYKIHFTTGVNRLRVLGWAEPIVR